MEKTYQSKKTKQVKQTEKSVRRRKSPEKARSGSLKSENIEGHNYLEENPDLNSLIQSSSLQQRFRTLKLSVEQVGDHQDPKIEFEKKTEIVIKDPTSYLIMSETHGHKLIEKGVEIFTKIYKKKLKFSPKSLFYSKRMNSYFTASGSFIYRKKINKRPFEPFIETSLGDISDLAYSHKHQRLLIHHRGSEISINFLNLATRKSEFKLKNTFRSPVVSFALVKPEEDKLVVLHSNLNLILYTLFWAGDSRRVLALQKLNFSATSLERLLPVQCAQSDEIFIFMAFKGTFGFQLLSSEPIAVKVIKISQKSKIDNLGSLFQYDPVDRDCMKSLEVIYQISGSHIYFLGFAPQSEGEGGLSIFDYNFKSNALGEVLDQRVESLAQISSRLVRFGKDFFYLGLKGKLMKVTFSGTKNEN